MAQYNFSIEDTNQAKGVALLLLLWHHLFYRGEGGFGTLYIGNIELVQQLGILSKVCVAIFVFLSGYGLYRSQMGKQVGLKTFYLSHYSKLYETYWLIWLIFVPISIFIFGRSFASVYPENTWLYLILNFFGMQNTVAGFGYNVTWWFMTCIITLYFIYPFLKVLIDKFDFLILALVFVFTQFSINASFRRFDLYSSIEGYLLIFVFGIIVSKHDFFVKIKELRYSRLLKIVAILIFFACVVFLRSYPGKKIFLLDGMLTYLIIQFFFLLDKKSKVLIFIGKHSYSIFLFHTFIYYYFFKDLIYSFHYPVVIFLVLLAVCLAISMGIESIKTALKLKNVTRKISNKRFNNDIIF